MNCSGIGCPVAHDSFAEAQRCTIGCFLEQQAVANLTPPPTPPGPKVSEEPASSACLGCGGPIDKISSDCPKCRIRFLEISRPKLVDYLKMKLEAEDWHGCQDAASDLRDLDSELDGLRF